MADLKIEFDYWQCFLAYHKLLREELSNLGIAAVDRAKQVINSNTSGYPDEWVHQVAAYVEYDLAMQYEGSATEDIELSLDFGILDQDDEAILWKAMVINYGVGQLMADGYENPNLNEYKQSSDYNNRRNSDNTILSRPEQEYYDPWQPNAKTTSKAKSEFPIPNFAHEAVFWLENITAIYFSDPIIQIAIAEATDKMDWSKYMSFTGSPSDFGFI